MASFMYLKYKRSLIMKPLSKSSPYTAQLEAPTINPCTFPLVARSKLVTVWRVLLILIFTNNNNSMYTLFSLK